MFNVVKVITVKMKIVNMLIIKFNSYIILQDIKLNIVKVMSIKNNVSIINIAHLRILINKSKLSCCIRWKKINIFMISSIKQYGALTPISNL